MVQKLKYDSFYSLFGTFLAGKNQLIEFSADSPLNTDDNPVVVFRAPQFVYSKPAPAHERLLALVDELSPADPGNVLIDYITEEDLLARDRITAYWEARNAFLHAGVNIEQTNDVKKLYETAREPLLKVVRKSLDFSAAYYPLLAIAYEIYPHDQDASYQLLTDLMRANPMRREAGILRSKIFVN
jgi:spermidine synthase